MKKALYVFAIVASFIVLFPLSWRIADRYFFTHPFEASSFDPVLVLCQDHMEIRRFHELDKQGLLGSGCTFQVSRLNQKSVEEHVHNLPSPSPKKAGWVIRVKQLNDNRQRIDLFLMGDGIAGMIYEVRGERIIPLESRLTGPLGALFSLAINICVCATAWIIVWRVIAVRQRGRAAQAG